MDTELKPVVEGVCDPGPPPRLIGGYCPECRRRFFPNPEVCPGCLGTAQDVDLSREGTIYSYTVVRTKPPFGLPLPYPVAYVDLDGDGLRIFSLLDPERTEEYQVGQRVTLRVGPMGVNSAGQRCLRYYFAPREGGGP